MSQSPRLSFTVRQAASNTSIHNMLAFLCVSFQCPLINIKFPQSPETFSNQTKCKWPCFKQTNTSEKAAAPSMQAVPKTEFARKWISDDVKGVGEKMDFSYGEKFVQVFVCKFCMHCEYICDKVDCSFWHISDRM